jgi:predicted DCC family thiol-disulfide oxidoreductase YuxK
MEKLRGHALVLYDAECGFCQFWVRFIIARDPCGYFVFAPLGVESVVQLGKPAESSGDETLLLYQGGQMYSHSEAVIRIATALSFPWTWARFCRYVPRRVRDRVYQLVAKHRHRWCKAGTCSALTPEERQRFIAT